MTVSQYSAVEGDAPSLESLITNGPDIWQCEFLFTYCHLRRLAAKCLSSGTGPVLTSGVKSIKNRFKHKKKQHIKWNLGPLLSR